MAILFTDNARLDLARSVYRDIVNENEFYYYFVGRTETWDNESQPDTPINSIDDLNQAHRDMLFVKRVQPNDVCLMIRRIDWEDGVVFDAYDNGMSEEYPASSGATTLSESNFYVLTDEFQVYKCLFNNNGEPSTIKPTGTSNAVFETGDGYLWKFMCRVNEADQQKFLTPTYIPVRKMSGTGSFPFDVNGQLDDITVTDGGSDYLTTPNIIILGDGSGATASATIEDGVITDITVDDPGSGYTFALVRIVPAEGDTGSGAIAEAVLGGYENDTIQEAVEASAIDGTVDRIVMIDDGEGYVPNTVIVTITGDGQSASATANVNAIGGNIQSVDITEQGTNYSYATVSFESTTGGSGADARVIHSPKYGHGANPPRELYATNVAISVNLTADTSDLFIANDYRQLGLIRNPYKFNTTNIYTNNTATTCYVIEVNNPDDYNIDDVILTDSEGHFIVVSKYDSNNDTIIDQIFLLKKYGTIYSTSILTNQTQSLDNLTINNLIEPEIDKMSGEIVLLENKIAVERSDTQVEKIRTILTF